MLRLIERFQGPWRKHAERCLAQVHGVVLDLLRHHVGEVLDSSYPRAAERIRCVGSARPCLRHAALAAAAAHMPGGSASSQHQPPSTTCPRRTLTLQVADELHASAASIVADLSAMEEQGGGQLREAFTLNSGYFATSKSEFLERLQDKHHNLLSTAGVANGSGSASNGVGDWLKEGVAGAQRSQLLRSVLKDEFEDALELMAATLAYFRVASRRFADVVPMAIRLRLLEPLAKELRAMLRERLLQGLDGGAGAGGGGGSSSTAGQLMQEAPQLAKKRERLEKRCALLQNVQKLLDGF